MARERLAGRRTSVGQRARRAFTLMELLIVIAVIAILIALLMGGVGYGWEVAHDTQCKGNLAHLYKAMHAGVDGRLPEPDIWVGWEEAHEGGPALLCPTGDSSVLPARTVTPVVPGGDPDTVLPPIGDPTTPPEQDVTFIDPPKDMWMGTNGKLESNTDIFFFTEKKNFTLPSAVSVNVTAPGFVDSAGKCSPGSVPGGTKVNSHLMHFDPLGNGPAMASGSVNFPTKVLGLIFLDAQLDASDPILGVAGTRYATGQKSRGFELGTQEAVTLSDDRKTVVINRLWSSSMGEEMRILVEAPEETNPDMGSVGSATVDPTGMETYGAGGATSYGMNNQATPDGVWAGQVLLIEYHRALVDLDGQGADDNFNTMVAPRHMGHVNVLFGDGNVEGMSPDDLNPAVNREIWKPKVQAP